MYSGQVNIPWNDPKCANTAWTKFDGDVTESSPNWGKWRGWVTRGTDVTCSGAEKKGITLKQAVQDCSGVACTG